MNNKDKILCAIGTPDLEQAVSLSQRLQPHIGGFKLGLEFFTANGPSGIEKVAESGMPVFLDLKFHDIPNTVAGAVRSAIRLKPILMTIHASGGPEMMRAAAEAAKEESDKQNLPCPLLLAVTVLTSMDKGDLDAIGMIGEAHSQVLRLAELAQTNGINGIVCSPREIELVKKAFDNELTLVVPGIRPVWAAKGDQKRIMTPADAVRAGADYLVIGRPITQADNPEEAAQKIAEEIG